MNEPPNWSSLRVLLRDESRRVLGAFWQRHQKDDLRGIGFVFALWNNTPQLDLCAHVSPLSEDDEERFNSGDYDFPAGLTANRRELGPAWWVALCELHARAAAEGPKNVATSAIYRGLIELTGTVLLDLRAEGQVPEGVDFNVSEVGDDPGRVAARHDMLTNWRVPDSGREWHADK